jgi:hypothetical protein
MEYDKFSESKDNIPTGSTGFITKINVKVNTSLRQIPESLAYL